jgi:hypothetical protein
MVRMGPQQLWARLTQRQQQMIVRLLSDLIQKHLLPVAGKGVADERR